MPTSSYANSDPNTSIIAIPAPYRPHSTHQHPYLSAHLCGGNTGRRHLATYFLLIQVSSAAGRRLDPDGWNRPLDDYTAEAISDYLAYRWRGPNP